jgi:peptidoglycan hydrolase-like protein with peptidoglycan-binding domain/GH25 family lysozyme M1 (1,4-beta-N-acetylmuramidase)
VPGTITYLVDCASYQGSPDWGRVAAICGGGAEKVTEGAGATAYVNPRWAASKPSMLAQARYGFVPLAYLFLDAAEPGGAQAEFFASHAGDLTGFGVVLDFERAPNGNPSLQEAEEAAAELRRLYPGHPVGGYCPHWYTGGEDLSFTDWLWASSYVIGSGDPAMLYAQVPAAWWAPYGGRSPLLLQFTAAASVAGISGPVDCSAFHGSSAQLASHVLPAAKTAPTIPSSPWPADVTLRDGDSGAAVRELQRMLRDSGIPGVRGIAADGSFGPQTLTAVRNFQAHEGLAVDGVAGPETHAALASLRHARADAPATQAGDDDAGILISLMPGAAPVRIPVWAGAGNCSLVLSGDAGAAVKVTLYSSGSAAPDIRTVSLAPGRPVVVAPGSSWSALAEVGLQRLDTKSGLGASAVLRTW